MALTDENSMVMPVAPMYGGNNGGFGGFGGDWGWIILLLLFAGGGYGGFGGMGGYGNMMLGYDFPWLMTGQQGINTNTNNGFRDAMINDNITSVRDGIAGLSTQLCGCCGDMQMALANGFAGVEQGANARQIANMQQQLLQMKKLMEEMLARQSNLLGEFVAKLGTVQQVATFEQPVQKSPQQSTQHTTSPSRHQSQIKQQRQTESQQSRVEPLQQEHTIYVRPSIDGSNIVLTPVSEAYADRATFVVKAQGDKGTYAFNKAATKSVISYLDNMLTPYCECSLLTNGSVSSVTPTVDGTVEKQGDKWLVISKAQVSIS